MSLLPGGGRSYVQLDNRVQTACIELDISTELEVAGFAAGPVRGDGRVTNGLRLVPISENGTDMVGEVRGRAARLIAEAQAGQAFPAVTLPASAALPIGVYPIREKIFINLYDPQGADPVETSYMEADPSSPLRCEAEAIGAMIDTLVGVGALGATVTLAPIVISVTQHEDPARSSLPLATPRWRQIIQTINGTNPDDLFRIPTRQRLRSLLFMQEAQLATGGIVAVDDAFLALRLIGDDGRNIIGPQQQGFQSLVESQAALQGGEIAYDAFYQNFQRMGRLSYTIVPEREYPNFRAEISDAISATGTTSRGVVTVCELIRRPPQNGYPTVVPPTITLPDGSTIPNPAFPDWMR
jgi:hypothetical protein